MAAFPLVLLQLSIVAFVEVMTAQNVTLSSWVEVWTIPDFHVPPIAVPKDFCASSFSCSNTQDTDRLCKCDSMCGHYGDCCRDAVNTTQDFPPSYPARDLYQCRQFPGASAEIGINDAPSGYLLVSRCPEGTDEDMKSQCEEETDTDSYVMAESFLPIKDENGVIYKNIHCARCNQVNESNISIWEALHDCWTCPTSLNLLPDYKVQLSSPDCSISPISQWDTARSCSTGFTDFCPPDYDDSDVITECHNYFSPGVWNVTWYKNPHCAICHGLPHVRDYLCAPVLSSFGVFGNGDDVQDDLFGGLWLLNFFYVKPTMAVEEKVSEIRRLSQCTRSYPQHLYLAVQIPNHRLQFQSCPYFGKRLEKCVNNQLSRLSPNGIELPWKQIVKLHDADPFSSKSTLLYYIPTSLTMQPYWESQLVEIYTFLLRSKKQCDFEDLYFQRFCGNFSSPEEVSAPCDKLLETNSSYILARDSDNGATELLNPWTNETVKGVLWFAFEASVNGQKIQSYKSQICQVKESGRPTTDGTDVHQFRGEFTTLEPSRSRPSRLPPVEQIFSNVCISLSILCLLLTFITYFVFASLRNSFGITLMNFVAVFAIGQFLTHFVTDYVTQWPVVCSAVAVAAHFVWLATFAWMNLLAWNLKSTFDNKKLRAVNYTSRRTMFGYFCYGWILPLCVVLICLTTFFVFNDTVPITYGLVQGVTCWIGNGWIAFSVIIGPLAVTIIVNGILFSLIVNGIRRSRFRPNDPEMASANDRGKITELLIYIKISLLMGFVWTLGFFIPFDKSRILWYTYYALQALQGILVMLLFAFNRRVRSLWRSKLKVIEKRSMSSHTRKSTV